VGAGVDRRDLRAPSSRRVTEVPTAMTTFPSTLLLATDGSEDARLAGHAVAGLAVATGATVHVVGAWNMSGPLLGSVSTKVLHGAGGPVLVTPGRRAGGGRGSPHSVRSASGSTAC